MPLRLVILALLAAWLAPLGARAAESAPVHTSHDTVTLVSETDAIAPGRPFRVGLRMRLAPGWHVYWRNPGDAGVPPEVALTLPPGVSAGAVTWPAPRRQPEGPLMTYGYSGEVLLPLTVTGARGDVDVAAHATWVVCEKVCIPEEGDFALHLPAATDASVAASAEAALFARADATIPRPFPFEAVISGDGSRLRVTGDGLAGGTVADAWLIPSEWGRIDASAAQTVSPRSDGFDLLLTPAKSAKASLPLDGVLAIRDAGGQTSYFDISAKPAPIADARSLPSFAAFAGSLGLAFLGGLVLNLMPCVFPVLAMKAMALVRLSAAAGGAAAGAARGAALRHAFAYTAGVLAAFAALAGTMLLLRAGGDAVGWGFQFQSPTFVAATAAVLFVVGLNLSGVYAVPGAFADVGGGLAVRGGWAGSFFTGLLAVVVATPCTAPFMGAAIAAAFAAPAVITLAVFAAMGLGLATPQLLLALAPAVARAMPRPGAWMEVMRQALAFPMYGAALWLVWVVGQQTGVDGMLALGVALLCLAVAAWGIGRAQAGRGRFVRGAAAGLAMASVVLSGLAASTIGNTPSPAATAAEGIEPFSPSRLASLRAAGRPVFVNMTAAWCVTCLVNERVAMSPDRVREAFAQNRVVTLKGDWTRQDPAITAFLRDHGRDGVPLYLFYPAGGGPEIQLPQILTAGSLIAAVTHAGG